MRGSFPVGAAFLLVSAAVLGGEQPAVKSARVLELPGTVEAYETTDVYAKTSGYVQEVLADLGDHVAAGKVLAVIDAPELKQDLQVAKAALKAAEANQLQAQAKLEVARSQLISSQAQAKLREATFRRRKELAEGKAATEQDLDEAQAQRDAAQGEVEVARARIAAAEADIESAKASRELAAAQVEKTNALVQYTQITAPFDGIVTRRLIDRGALVQAATATRAAPLFTVQRIDQVRVFIDVPESDIAAAAVGAPATVKAYGLPGKPFQGAVTRTASSLNPSTRTMRAEIDLPNPENRLLHGMYAQVLLPGSP